MPPKQPKISDAEIATIRKWIELGRAGNRRHAPRNLHLARRKSTWPLSSTGKARRPAADAGEFANTRVAKVSSSPSDNGSGRQSLARCSSPSPATNVFSYTIRTHWNSSDRCRSRNEFHLCSNSVETESCSWPPEAAARRVAERYSLMSPLETVWRKLEMRSISSWLPISAPIINSWRSVARISSVKIYETETGELKHRIKKHTDWVTALEFSPDGQLVASGDRNGGVYVWEAETGGIVFTLGDHRESITDLSWRADSQMLASSSEDGRVILGSRRMAFRLGRSMPTWTAETLVPRIREIDCQAFSPLNTIEPVCSQPSGGTTPLVSGGAMGIKRRNCKVSPTFLCESHSPTMGQTHRW